MPSFILLVNGYDECFHCFLYFASCFKYLNNKLNEQPNIINSILKQFVGFFFVLELFDYFAFMA